MNGRFAPSRIGNRVGKNQCRKIANLAIKLQGTVSVFYSIQNSMPHAYTEDQLVEQPAIGLAALLPALLDRIFKGAL
jgi:hypothetical protein